MNDLKNSCITGEELSAHLDGDLESPRTEEVAAHINSCVQCFGAAKDMKELKNDLPGLGRIRPSIDLWRKIDDALEEDQTTADNRTIWLRWLVPIPLAAAAVLAFVLYFPKGPVDDRDVAPPEIQNVTAAIAAVERAESAYQDAIVSLEKVYKSEKSSFNPKTLAVVEKSLAEIDAAISRCRKAMYQDPSNVEANRAMLAAYRQKMDFLFELVGPSYRPKGA